MKAIESFVSVRVAQPAVLIDSFAMVLLRTEGPMVEKKPPEPYHDTHMKELPY